ncbi:hypothetical protein B566_EDAN017397 [Ephemera danica]|nr:hypothetical protein B566_EDAN017397 [Ephemera danica]
MVGSSFWIQVLAFDTWLTFLRIQDYGSCAPASPKRVRGYFIYAVLAPTLLMLPSIFVTFRKRHLYYEDPDQSDEEDKCNEEYWTEKFLFIVWVVVLITGCFFLASASARMRRLENDLRIRFHTQRQRLVVYRNLFTVLVVPTVVLEVLVPIVTSLMGDDSSPEWFKILCDSLFVISNLDGVWIFVASIWLTEYRSRICSEVDKVETHVWSCQSSKHNVKITPAVCQTKIMPTYSFKTTSV